MCQPLLEYFQKTSLHLHDAIRSARLKFEDEFCEPADLSPQRMRSEVKRKKDEQHELVLATTVALTRDAVVFYQNVHSEFQNAQNWNGCTPDMLKREFMTSVSDQVFPWIETIMLEVRKLRDLVAKLGFELQPAPEVDAYIEVTKSIDNFFENPNINDTLCRREIFKRRTKKLVTAGK